MCKILVTGHSGFLGQALVKRLLLKGYGVLGCSRANGHDVAQPDWAADVQGSGIGHCFHLAAASYVPDSWAKPTIYYQTNTMGTQHVLQFCAQHKIPMTYVSAYLYGMPEYLPIDEAHPLKPNNPYAHSKALAEGLCNFYREYLGLDVHIVRPFNVYGCGQALQFLVPKILRNLLANMPLRLQDITPKRDFIYVDDVVDALLLFLSQSPKQHVFNLGMGISHSVYDVALAASRVTGKPLQLECTNMPRPNEIPDTVANIHAMEQTFGWAPKVTLEQGLESMAQHLSRKKDFE